MKKLLVISLLVASSFAYGQTKLKIRTKTTFDKDSIISARIGKYLAKTKCLVDSCWDISYRDLSREQINYFVDQWNHADYIGEKRLKPDYCLEFSMKDGAKKVIKVNNSLNEKKNDQYTIEDKRFLKNLWANAMK